MPGYAQPAPHTCMHAVSPQSSFILIYEYYENKPELLLGDSMILRQVPAILLFAPGYLKLAE